VRPPLETQHAVCKHCLVYTLQSTSIRPSICKCYWSWCWIISAYYIITGRR